ncbi:MAG: chromate transporter [Bacteroidales bacterium]|nr:chromate transporter [Bacteroidales bacterium]
MIWQLFVSFFKIGTFTIGGGYAMIPLMQREIVERRQWYSDDDFVNQLSLSQAMPGVFAVNMATAVGYRQAGVKGSVAAILGAVAVPIAIILLLAMFFGHFKDNATISHIFMGIRPAVVALIAATVFNMARAAHVGWHNMWMPVVALLLVWIAGVSPIWVIIGAAVAGAVYGFLKGGRKE